jgi:hypothetical protein
VEVASEPVTPEESWRLLPEASVLGVDPDYRLRILALRVPAQSAPRRGSESLFGYAFGSRIMSA